LPGDDLVRLRELEPLDLSILNESVCRFLIEFRQDLGRERKENGELQNEVEHQRQEIEDVRKEVARAQSERVALKTANDQRQSRIGELEGQRCKQEENNAKQDWEIANLKAEKQKSEDELCGRVGDLEPANDGLKGEFAKLKEEIERPIVKPPSRRPAPPKQGKQLPMSVKKVGSRDVPDGIINHLRRERA
jgi:predicted  nucleic acid-binding Zn-ribbon protein